MSDEQSVLSGLYGNPAWVVLPLLGFTVFLAIALVVTTRIVRTAENRAGEKRMRLAVIWMFCGVFMAILGGVAVGDWLSFSRVRDLCRRLVPVLGRMDFGAAPGNEPLTRLDGPYLIYYCSSGTPRKPLQRLSGVGDFGEPPDSDGLPFGVDDHWKDFAAGEDEPPPGRANDMDDPLASASVVRHADSPLLSEA